MTFTSIVRYFSEIKIFLSLARPRHGHGQLCRHIKSLCLLWVLRPRPFHFFVVQGCHHTHRAQHDMSAREEGRADYHNAVQTGRQGRGSRGWSHWASSGLASQHSPQRLQASFFTALYRTRHRRHTSQVLMVSFSRYRPRIKYNAYNIV